MKIIRRLAMVLGLLAGITVPVVASAPAAFAAAPSHCQAGWFFYVHAPYPNAFGSNEMDAWATCVPNGTSVPWPDAQLGWGCGIQQIINMELVPDPAHPGLMFWAGYGNNFENGRVIGGWGNTFNAGIGPWKWSYSVQPPPGDSWATAVLAECSGYFYWGYTSAVPRY